MVLQHPGILPNGTGDRLERRGIAMSERRQYPRFDKDLTIEYSYRNSQGEHTTSGRLLNISLGGLFMVSGAMVEKDSQLKLHFHLLKDGKEINLVTDGTILRSGPVEQEDEMMKRYGVGSEFGAYFAVVKFLEPFFRLSFMLQ
jgi:c-di-GMP-binding flagellar brake protein YcgR